MNTRERLLHAQNTNLKRSVEKEVIKSKILRVDSFAAYAYTRRILNAYAVANKRVDNPQKTIRAKRISLIITFNVKAKSKASFKNYDLLGFKCCRT